MKLYHGTSERNLEKLLKDGLAPRGEGITNWKEYPSRPDMVYLTQAYALYFAISASDTDTERCLIMEIDTTKLNQTKFFPDEDFLAQEAGSLMMHEFFRDNIFDHKKRWKDSLLQLGNVAYRGKVHPYAFSRYCLFDAKVRPEIAMNALDPTISIMNYKFCGPKYRRLISWLFEDTDQLLCDYEIEGAKIRPDAERFLKIWEEEGKKRDGVEVVNLKEV